MNWKFIGSTSDKFFIDGIDIFKEKWIDTEETINIKDPLYGQKFTFTVWKINNKGKDIIFASGEFSNSVYGIYQKL